MQRFLWFPLAQVREGPPSSFLEILTSPIGPALMVVVGITGLFTFCGVIILLAMKQAKRARELTHLERLKAIEQGLSWQAAASESEPTPEQEFQGRLADNRFWISFWIMVFGAATPFIAVAMWLSDVESASYGVMTAGLMSAGAASVAAAVCTMKVMTSSLIAREKKPKS